MKSLFNIEEMPEDGTLVVECRICLRMHPYMEMQQILPCFHLFCKQCINAMINYRQALPTNSKKKVSTDTLTCPAANCHSQLRSTSSDSSIIICYCDNVMCPKKLSQFESTRLSACQHEICTTCLEESLQRQPPACIVENCDRTIIEVEEPIFCDGCGKQLVDTKITTSCCKCHLCEQCVESRASQNLFDKATLKCADGKCLSPKKKAEPVETAVKCKGRDGCEGEALNGFPSNSECSHDVCIQCLQDMISDCEATGAAPMCPASTCRQYYTIESVNALRTLLPQKAEFFQRFDLDERKMDVLLKDESVTFMDLSSEFDFASRRMTVRAIAEGEEEGEQVLTYDKQGTIGDFIREVRRVLKILPYEKIYGYFIRREDDEAREEKEADEEIAIDAASMSKCISELHLTPTCIVRVDTAGIVQQKSSTSLTRASRT